MPSISEEDETCPVCKTTRYFNRDMEFRINPECYHRMCRTCVDRIFQNGPSQCPYSGCHKTLRLRGFKSAFFSDLQIEREVDIRRRVASVFNKRQSDFDDLQAYNDYLDQVECLTADLVNGNDKARNRAETQLADWEALHRTEIEENRRFARECDEDSRKRLLDQQHATRQRRLQDLQAGSEGRASIVRMREELLDTLQTAETGHASEAMNIVQLKKRGQGIRDATRATSASTRVAFADKNKSRMDTSTGLSIRGLRDRSRGIDEAHPYDPFGGLDLASQRLELLENEFGSYKSEWIEAVCAKSEYVVGGYCADEYISRALFEAFAGLGVYVAEDKRQKF